MKSSERPWRSLVRISKVGEDFIHVIVPGWSSSIEVNLDKSEIPEEIRKLAEPGKRFHARVNIGAESKRDLIFKNWETK